MKLDYNGYGKDCIWYWSGARIFDTFVGRTAVVVMFWIETSKIKIREMRFEWLFEVVLNKVRLLPLCLTYALQKSGKKTEIDFCLRDKRK